MVSTGLVFIAVVFFLLLGIVFYFIIIYNGLITVKNGVHKSWSNIDSILDGDLDKIITELSKPKVEEK